MQSLEQTDLQESAITSTLFFKDVPTCFAGVERRFPKGTIYPGFIALYRALTEARHYRRMHRIQSQRMLASANGSPERQHSASIVSAQDSTQVDQVLLSRLQVSHSAALSRALCLHRTCFCTGLVSAQDLTQGNQELLSLASHSTTQHSTAQHSTAWYSTACLLSLRQGEKMAGYCSSLLIYKQMHD